MKKQDTAILLGIGALGAATFFGVKQICKMKSYGWCPPNWRGNAVPGLPPGPTLPQGPVLVPPAGKPSTPPTPTPAPSVKPEQRAKEKVYQQTTPQTNTTATKAEARKVGQLDYAAKMAPAIATMIDQKKYNYDRKQLRLFQQIVGLKPDGIYGGGTAGALKFFLNGKEPPKPLFKPYTVRPYIPKVTK